VAVVVAVVAVGERGVESAEVEEPAAVEAGTTWAQRRSWEVVGGLVEVDVEDAGIGAWPSWFSSTRTRRVGEGRAFASISSGKGLGATEIGFENPWKTVRTA
jgi:hypothetical protein